MLPGMLKWALVVVAAIVATTLLVMRRHKSSSYRHAPAPSQGAAETSSAIDEFWQWWPTVSDEVARSMEEGRSQEWIEEISRHVHAIDPGLAWELGPGNESSHHLALSAEGDLENRVLTQRWLAKAPAPDRTWEYYPARQAHGHDPALTTKIDGIALSNGDCKVEYEAVSARELIDVHVYHPEFHRLDESQQGLAAFLFLDGLLGEDSVERWLGEVAPSAQPLQEPVSPESLRAAVEKLSLEATGERFAMLEGTTPEGELMMAMVNLALKRTDHLLMEVHQEIHIPLGQPSPEGLAYAEEADSLNTMEDELLELLGHDAVYIGHETGRGERIIHLHSASNGPAAGRIDNWVRRYPDQNIEVRATHDPSWAVLRRW